MKTLVTGANGHLGNTIVKKLLAKGRKVRAMVRATSNLAGLKDHSGKLLKGVELAYADVMDQKAFAAAMKGCEVIHHTAAVFKTRLDSQGEAGMMQIALEGTRNLCELAAKLPKKPRILYTSSVAAVGCSRRPELILDEATWNEKPIDAYVDSKAKSEKVALLMMRQLKLDMVFLNPGTILGPNDFGPTPSSSFILLAMKKATPVYFAGGHSYTDVEDVAEAHLAAEKKGKAGERYILAGENISVVDSLNRIAVLTHHAKPMVRIGHVFVSVAGLGFETLAGFTGKPPLFTRKKAHQLIDYYGYFNSEKARRDLGYRFRSFDELLVRSKSWYQKMGWL